MYLVGDIGGTKTNIAILENQDGKLKTTFEKSFPSKDYDSLQTILKKIPSLISHLPSPISVCFGVAGPVKDGMCDATNLPWIIDSKKTAEVLNLNLSNVFLLNDLEAAAYGIDLLEKKDVYILNKGNPIEGGARCLISPGTGLGESIIFWDGKKYKPCPSEGGHTDFAPRNKIEIDLLTWLINKYGRVSYERILCGPGLLNSYNYFRETAFQETPKWLLERLKKEDPSAVISELGIAKKDEACEKAVELFISVLGAEAGNLALTCLATGGVFIGGGIPPKILEKIKEGGFMQAFSHKGRLSVMVSKMPVYVILNAKLPLLGCANYLECNKNGINRI